MFTIGDAVGVVLEIKNLHKREQNLPPPSNQRRSNKGKDQKA